MTLSKDVEAILKMAEATALLYDRPYICLDSLWHSFFASHNSSIAYIVGTEIDSQVMQLGSHLILHKKKTSTKPSKRKGPDTSKLLKLCEDFCESFGEPDVSIEILFLALLCYPKKGKMLPVLLDESGRTLEDMIERTIMFINEINLPLEAEEAEEEVEEEKKEEAILEYFDPLSDDDFLEEYLINLNKKAEAGEYDDLVDFGKRTEKVATVLCRTRKPNPILVGPAGSGKTATAQILAREINNGNIEGKLKDHVIFELSLSTLVAGTEFRGSFENRLQNIINEIMKFDNIILFIDEIHALIGAGGTGRKGDLEASNILKPYLARGDISCIGATTDYEYNQKFKKDPALSRRFEKILIPCPSFSQMKTLGPKILDAFADNHTVEFYEEFGKDALSKCKKFLPNRNFPDKYIDAIDHSCGIARKEGRTFVEKEDLETFFADKSCFYNSDSLIKELCSRLKEKNLKTKTLSESLKTLRTEEEITPPSLFLSGSAEDLKGAIYETEHFLRDEGLSFVSVSGKNLVNAASIIGYSDDFVLSLAQKASVLDSPVILIKDSDKVPQQVANLLYQILSDGEVQMFNGELVSFTNCLFLFFAENKKTKSIGFSKEQEEQQKPSYLKRVVKKSVNFS